MTDRIDTRSAVRTCAFSYSGNMVAYSTDRAMGQQCVINIVDVRTFSNQGITLDKISLKIILLQLKNILSNYATKLNSLFPFPFRKSYNEFTDSC